MRELAPVVQKLDCTIHWINLCSEDNAIGLLNIYPLDNNLFSGERYPAFRFLGRRTNKASAWSSLAVRQSVSFTVLGGNSVAGQTLSLTAKCVFLGSIEKDSWYMYAKI